MHLSPPLLYMYYSSSVDTPSNINVARLDAVVSVSCNVEFVLPTVVVHATSTTQCMFFMPIGSGL